MSKSVIEGIGSIYGGVYDEVRIEGIGKLKGDLKTASLNIEGVFKSKARIEADTINCEGVARLLADVKAKTLNIEGVVKIRYGKLEADNIICDGVLISSKEISADKLFVDGLCSINKFFGEEIVIKHNSNSMNKTNLPVSIKPFDKLYLGRTLSSSHSLVDKIECSRLEASSLQAKIVKAH
ncbi:MAG: hypothetical protein ACOC3B_02860, partial [Bacillota bacterium]